MNADRKKDPRPTSEVKTALQYLARTHRQQLLFYGSAFAAAYVDNRTVIAVVALVMADFPRMALIVLSVVNRAAMRALGTDYSTEPRSRPADEGDDSSDGSADASRGDGAEKASLPDGVESEAALPAGTDGQDCQISGK